MEISLKDYELYRFVQESLMLIDERLINHGRRTAFLVLELLKCDEKYTKEQLARIAMLVTLHDIGAYQTEDIGDMLRFENRDYIPHAVFGYMVAREFFDFDDLAKVILYHHSDYIKIKDIKYSWLDVASYLNLAEKVDIYQNALARQFDFNVFASFRGQKYHPQGIDLFRRLLDQDILQHIRSGKYLESLDSDLQYLSLTDVERENCIALLAFAQTFEKTDTYKQQTKQRLQELQVLNEDSYVALSEKTAKQKERIISQFDSLLQIFSKI